MAGSCLIRLSVTVENRKVIVAIQSSIPWNSRGGERKLLRTESRQDKPEYKP
jgi:hypothetical protein